MSAEWNTVLAMMESELQSFLECHFANEVKAEWIRAHPEYENEIDDLTINVSLD